MTYFFLPSQPVINPHELFLSQINSTVVNQSLKNAPGELNFRVTFDQHEKVTKNMTWTYSNEVRRLYVMLNSQCPFKISTNAPPPENSYIVCIPAYKDAVSEFFRVMHWWSENNYLSDDRIESFDLDASREAEVHPDH